MVDLPFALTQHVDQIVDSFTDFVYKIWEVDTKFVRTALIGHYPQPPNAFPSLLTCAMVSPISNVSSTFTIRIQISRIRLRLNHRQERPTSSEKCEIVSPISESCLVSSSGGRVFSPILLLLLVQQDILNTLLTKDRQIELPLRYLRKPPREGSLKAERTAWTTPSGPAALPKRQTTSTEA